MMTSIPGIARGRDRGERVRAAVARDEHLGPGGDGGVDAGHREIVSVLDAARDERNRIATEAPNRSQQHRGGAHSVDVVIAVNHDALAGTNGAREPLDGDVHAEHEGWVVELIESRAEEALRAIHGAESAPEQELADHGRQVELVRQGRDGRRIWWRWGAPSETAHGRARQERSQRENYRPLGGATSIIPPRTEALRTPRTHRSRDQPRSHCGAASGSRYRISRTPVRAADRGRWTCCG